MHRAAKVRNPPTTSNPRTVSNQPEQQQAGCNSSVEQRCVLKVHANTMVEIDVGKLCCMIVLEYCVNTSNGFVAQIFLRLCFTSPQTDSAYGNGTKYAKSYEAV